MANRAKRTLLSTEKQRTEQQYLQLFQESDRRHHELKIIRDAQQAENRRYRRLVKRGLPDWVITNPVAMKLIDNVDHYRHNMRRTLKSYPWHIHIHLGDLEVELPRFLFEKYLLPKFFQLVWGENDQLAMSWYVHLGVGGSFRTSPNLPFKVNRKIAHQFIQAPDLGSVLKSLLYALVIGHGGSFALAKEFVEAELDLTAQRMPFWVEVIQWFNIHKSRSCFEIKGIIRYLQARKFNQSAVYEIDECGEYSVKQLDPDFSIVGQRYDTISSLATSFHWSQNIVVDFSRNTIIRQVGGFTCTTGGGQKPLVTYRIRPLTTVEEVQEEGRKMNHCVAGRIALIALNETSIWSLTKQIDGKRPGRMLTIELGGEWGIYQMLGICNRAATGTEELLVGLWCRQQGLPA